MKSWMILGCAASCVTIACGASDASHASGSSDGGLDGATGGGTSATGGATGTGGASSGAGGTGGAGSGSGGTAGAGGSVFSGGADGGGAFPGTGGGTDAGAGGGASAGDAATDGGQGDAADASSVTDAAGDGAMACSFGTAASVGTNQSLDLFGQIVYFDDGKVLPPGHYRVTYVDGCMKYASSQGWTIHAYANGLDAWWLVGDTTSDKVIMPPGTVGYDPGAGAYANFADCVTANLALPPVEFDFAGGKLGVWLQDSPYSDNLAGEDNRNPKWELTLLGACVVDGG